MKKSNFMYLFLTFIIMFSFNLKSASAEIGDRSTPYSAWYNYNFLLQEYEWDTPREVELQLFDIITGEEANEIVAEENMYNQKPAEDEEWILMAYDLKYVSGPEEPLYGTEVVSSYNSFYTNSGQKITPISTAIFSDEIEPYSEYNVQLYPGAESEVYYGILVKKTVGYPLIRIGMGYDSNSDQTVYGWFSTDPNYEEPILAPTSLKATASSYNSVKLSWGQSEDATGYEIYRSTSSTGTYTKIATTSTNSYTNTSLNTGTTYYYKVKAYKTGTSTQYSDFSSVVSAKPVLSTPTSVKAASSSYNSVKTSWAAVSGASGYEVYRATSSTGTYSKVGTTTSTSYNNTGLTFNKLYYYKIRSYRMIGSTKVYGNYSSVVSAKPVLSTPTSVKAASSSYNSVKTSWAAVSGASGYEVYRATSSTGTYSKVGTTTSTSFNNTGLSTNKTYYYKIKSYRMLGSTKYYSNYSSVVSAKPIPSVPTNFNVTRVNSTSAKTTWSSVSGASGYEVYRSTSSTGTYSLVKTTTSLSYTNSGLTTGKTYYYKVRSYRTVGSTKVYSGWTVIKSVKP
ncbi:fibronectin type III domain-containing protein [Gottfriedia acidiceleris]|uniref:fibronectin type III domain-containing protein n=1 Tax=Gottfriedia acidiceleris TaxID=371036 RepID=UPI003D196864